MRWFKKIIPTVTPEDMLIAAQIKHDNAIKTKNRFLKKALQDNLGIKADPINGEYIWNDLKFTARRDGVCSEMGDHYWTVLEVSKGGIKAEIHSRADLGSFIQAIQKLGSS